MDEFDRLVVHHLTGGVHDATPGRGFRNAVQALMNYADTMEVEEMAKPKPPVPKGGADTGKLGKHHGGNLHGNAKTGSTGKHAKPVANGGKK